MSLSVQQKERLIERFTLDPVFFCKTVLPKIFSMPIPWLHRGLLSIYTRRTKFLWQYGEVWKIIREFVHRDRENNILYPIFNVYLNDELLTWEEVRLMEEGEFSSDELADLLVIRFHISKFTAIIIPRGFAKTTICGFAIPLYFALLRTRDFMVYVSESATHSEMCVNNIRSELSSNPNIIEIFGNLVPERSDSSKKWTEKLFETTTGFAMAARGSGAQIRGLLHKGNRPQIELWDDLQSREDAQDSIQRQKLKQWAYQDAMPALPELDPDATIIALATLLDKNCFAISVLDDPEWTVIRLAVENEWGEYIWPENIDKEKDIAKKRQYEQAGLLGGYYLEYRSQAISEEAQKFRRNRFIYQRVTAAETVARVIYCDPAISEKTVGDYAVVQIGAITNKGIINLLDEWRGHALPDMVSQIVENYFRLAKIYRPQRHGFEGNGFQASLETTFRAEMFRKQYYFEPIKVISTQQKNARINALVHPLHVSGYLHFSKRFVETETELVEWQLELKDQADDGPDCLAGVVKLLHDFVGAGILPESVQEIKEDEHYDDIEVALGLKSGQDWRYA